MLYFSNHPFSHLLTERLNFQNDSLGNFFQVQVKNVNLSYYTYIPISGTGMTNSVCALLCLINPPCLQFIQLSICYIGKSLAGTVAGSPTIYTVFIRKSNQHVWFIRKNLNTFFLNAAADWAITTGSGQINLACPAGYNYTLYCGFESDTWSVDRSQRWFSPENGL